jgi:hypothetical protein
VLLLLDWGNNYKISDILLNFLLVFLTGANLVLSYSVRNSKVRVTCSALKWHSSFSHITVVPVVAVAAAAAAIRKIDPFVTVDALTNLLAGLHLVLLELTKWHYQVTV